MPDVVDYLGAPKVVTGAEYMDALARLGYNVENMSSPIPTMTKIASAQTNFLDNLYNQNIDRQAKQATLQETLARANNLDSVTDYNNKSLDQRLKALDQENQERDLSLLYQQRTLDSRVQTTNLQAQQAQANLDHDKKIYPLQESELDQKNQQAAIYTEALKTQQKGDQDALNEWPMAKADLNIPIDDPDFEQKIVDFYRNHPNVATNRQTKALVDSQVRSMEAARSNLASVQEANNNAKTLLGFKATGDLPANTNVDQLKADPDQAHQALVQGTVTQQNRRMSEILAGIGTNPPPELVGQARDLRDAQDRISSILAAPHNEGYHQIARGAWSQFFDANGRFNPTLESEIGALETYAQERVKQGLAKPLSTTVVIKAGDPINPSEIRVENVPFGQEAAVTARMQEALKSPEQRAKEAANLQQSAQTQQQNQAAAIIRANPDIDAMAKEAARTGKGWDKVQAAIAKKLQQQQQSNVPHMQKGGLVQASYTPGSESQMLPGTEPEIPRGTPGPDQVPAMLTDGEYVINKDAAQNIGLPALEALNAGDRPKFNLASGTSTTTGTGDEAPFNLASGTRPSVSTGTQQDVQFQQPQQTSAFQQLFGGVPYQSSVDAPPPGQLPNVPVTSQITPRFPILPTIGPAPRAMPVQTPAPRAQPAQTSPVTTGPTTGDTSLASTGGTTLMPKYTTGDALLNAHYLGDGKLSGLATNFGHDVNGKPDSYMISKLGGGSRIGAFGDDVVNPKTVGASIPVQTFRAFIGNPNDPQVRARVRSGQVGLEVWAPNGRSAKLHIVDLGPGKGENASLDLTGSAMRQLGVSDNFGAVYRIYSQ